MKLLYLKVIIYVLINQDFPLLVLQQTKQLTSLNYDSLYDVIKHANYKYYQEYHNLKLLKFLQRISMILKIQLQ